VQAVDDIEQYSKGSNLLIHGISVQAQPGSPEVDLGNHIIDYLNSNLGITVSENDINALHRLFKPGQLASAQSTMTKPPPVLIQFTNWKTRSLVLSKRKLLKGKRVLITEQLKAKKTQTLKKANDLFLAKKLLNAWLHDRKILVKTLSKETRVVTNTVLINFKFIHDQILFFLTDCIRYSYSCS